MFARVFLRRCNVFVFFEMRRRSPGLMLDMRVVHVSELAGATLWACFASLKAHFLHGARRLEAHIIRRSCLDGARVDAWSADVVAGAVLLRRVAR